MKEIRKSNSEIKYLREKIDSLVQPYGNERLMIECSKYKMASIDALEILKYVYPGIRQASSCPKLVVKWINDEDLTNARIKNKNLSKVPDDERSKYLKYRVGREIKVRYRFKDKTKKYQDIRLTQLYCRKLYKYLERNGY